MKCNCPPDKKKCAGMRKLTDMEKKLIEEHFEGKKHSKGDRMKMLNAICRGNEMKNKNDLKKLHNKLFSKKGY